MNCPIDNSQLAIAERQGIEIDYCPQCRGVWLDRGELDKIIDKSENATRKSGETSYHPDAHQYRQSEQGHYYPKHKKRESFLGDLFDF